MCVHHSHTPHLPAAHLHCTYATNDVLYMSFQGRVCCVDARGFALTQHCFVYLQLNHGMYAGTRLLPSRMRRFVGLFICSFAEGCNAT